MRRNLLREWAEQNAHKYKPCPVCCTVQIKLEDTHCPLCDNQMTRPQLNPKRPMETTELQSALSQHYGSQTYTRHWLAQNFLMTEGTVCFRENAGGGSWWLFDILATVLEIRNLVLKTGFALVVLEVSADCKALLTVQADTGETPVYSNPIDYTTCPVGRWEFFLELSEDIRGNPTIVCLLPSEH